MNATVQLHDAIAQARAREIQRFFAQDELSLAGEMLGLGVSAVKIAIISEMMLAPGKKPVEPPRSWKKEHHGAFAAMPVSLQEYIADHERQRERWFRTEQNLVSEKRKEERLRREFHGEGRLWAPKQQGPDNNRCISEGN